MTRALITGGDGFVGEHLTALLRAEGIATVSFDLRAGLDIRNYEEIRLAVEALNPDYVFHLAAQAYVAEGTTDPHRAIDVNTGGTLNLLEAIRHTGCRARIHIAGTSEEYGYETQTGAEISESSPCRPTTVYGVSKLAASNLGLVYARTYGMPIVVTRAFNHTGPGQPANYAIPSFAKQVAQVERGVRDRLRHGNLEAKRSYLDVRDVVRAYRTVIDCEPGIYNVAADRVHTMAEILDLLVSRATHKIPVEADPALYRPGWQKGSAAFPTPSGAKLAAATGWKPEISLEQTLADTLNYWREHP